MVKSCGNSFPASGICFPRRGNSFAGGGKRIPRPGKSFPAGGRLVPRGGNRFAGGGNGRAGPGAAGPDPETGRAGLGTLFPEAEKFWQVREMFSRVWEFSGQVGQAEGKEVSRRPAEEIARRRALALQRKIPRRRHCAASEATGTARDLVQRNDVAPRAGDCGGGVRRDRQGALRLRSAEATARAGLCKCPLRHHRQLHRSEFLPFLGTAARGGGAAGDRQALPARPREISAGLPGVL